MTKFTDAKLIKALRKHGGIQAKAADDLKVSRQAVNQRIAASEKLQQLVREIEEENKDLAEGVVIDGLKAGDRETARWYLGRKGRDRGYGTSTRIDDEQLAAIVAAMTPAQLRSLADD